MIRSIIITILTIGVISVSYWGYKEHEEKNALLLHAENTYQRSFHELSYRMDLLHDKIGTSLAMNSAERISPQFVDIWKLTSSASTNVSQLPLSLLPFHKTNEFLARLSDFTYKTAIRNLDDSPLTEEELASLQQYYEQAANIKDELRQAQHTALQNNLRWMDVELALISNDEEVQNSIIDSFRTVEDGIGEFAKGEEGTALMARPERKHLYESISGESKTEDQILGFSQDIFKINDGEGFTITRSGPASAVPNYNVSYQGDKESIFMDITEQGAHPITILVDREVAEPEISLNDALLEAENYLQTFDYKNMRAIESKQFGNVGVFRFLYTEDDVRVYPDAVVVKVALDNGDILGLNAKEYLMNHRDRSIGKAKLSSDEAKSFVNKNVEIQEEHIALIENKLEEEVLTYEFLGTLQDETFRIFINAETGMEEGVEKLSGAETNFDVSL